jgi:large subunit ribosomal protein L15
VGRGRGTGLGKTSGRGQKGASSRSGFRSKLSHAGGQVPLARHLPKRGFSNYPFRKRYDVVNLDTLQEHFDAGAKVGLDDLVARHLLKPAYGRLKVLGGGAISKAIHVVAHTVSASAKAKIEAAGGKVETLEPPRKVRKPVPRPQDKKPQDKKAEKKSAEAPEKGSKEAESKEAGLKEERAPKEKATKEKPAKEKAPKGKAPEGTEGTPKDAAKKEKEAPKKEAAGKGGSPKPKAPKGGEGDKGGA